MSPGSTASRRCRNGAVGRSHQLDGGHAGFIHQAFDQRSMNSLVCDLPLATCPSNHERGEKAGTQGIGLLMWLVTRAALAGRVSRLHSSCHIPILNTAASQLLLENQPRG